MISLALSALCLATLGSAQEARDTDPAQNLAFGKPVTFLPAPNYSGTAKADTDETDLTDGRLTEREDEHMWFETLAVGYSYGGRVNLALDLGEVQPIDEVAIRLLGGSVQAGITAPGWVEVLVADDEAGPYYRVAEYSRFTPGDREDYGVPRNEGTGWIWRLSFDDLNTRGRYVGLRLYSGGLSCSDEMYVFKGDHDASDVTFDESDLTDFTVHGAQLHFHKPVVHVTSNIVTPVPVGIVAETIDTESPMTISMTLPEGAEIAGGGLGGVSVDEADVDGRTYTWTIDTKGSSTKTFGRLYMTGSPEEDGPEITYQLTWGAHQSPVISIPVESIEIPEQPIIPKRLMTSLSWWSVGATMAWPDWQSAFEALGLNTLPASSTWFDPEDQETIDFVASARDAGYRIQTIDSTWHRMLGRRKGESEIYCQFEDGTSGKQLCPSYRGEFHDEELGRVAAAVSILQPTWFHDDIELWGWRGPQDPEKCTRCIADKADTGIETWDEWKLAKGEEMWRELYETVQEALADAGAPKCDMSVYDFRPGRAYQYFWPFDRLYPEVMQSAQVSTYTHLDPGHLELIGDEIRKDRQLMPKSDILPWTTPGDAGVFSGEDFYYSLLETFCNGARGTNFWSGRIWDADILAGYARAVRAVAPVEDAIVDGELYLPEVDGPGRVSGIQGGDDIVLLVADYHGDTDGTVNLKMSTDVELRITDLDTKEDIGTLAAGAETLEVNLAGQRARILHLRP